MTGPIDEAFVEIKPDLDGFNAEVKRELDASFKNIERKVDDLTNTVEREFDRLVMQIDLHFDRMASSIDHSFDDVKKDVRDAADSIATDIEVGTLVAKHAIDDLADDADHDFARIERSARKAGRGIGFSFSGVFASLKESLGNFGGAAGGAFSGLSTAASSAGGGDIWTLLLKGGLIAAAIPAVLGLGGALIDLVGVLATLPAFAGVAVAAIAPLIIAFHGVGDAVGALMSGDMKKFQESLKGLAPAAQSVIKELQKFVAPLKDIGKAVQQSFFLPLKGVLTTLLGQALPVLKTGLSGVGAALGRFFAGFGDLLAAPDILNDFKKLFEATGRIIDRVGPSLTKLFGTLIGTMEHGLPAVERIFDVIADGIDKFSAWLSQAMSSGQFEKWINEGLETLGDLWDLLKSIGGLIMSVFGNTGDEGRGFINQLTEMINKLSDFFKTAEGQQALQDLIDTLKEIGIVIGWLGVAFANVIRWADDFARWAQSAGAWLAALPGKIKGLWDALVNGVSSAWSWITTTVANVWNTITTFFTQLPGKIGAWLSSLPGLLQQKANEAFNAFFFAVGYGIGKILKFFIDLPGQVTGFLNSLWTSAKSIFFSGVNAVVSFVSALPGRVTSFISSMASQGKALFLSFVNTVVSYAQSLPGKVASYVSALPGRIASALSGLASMAYNIGQNIISSMINGISSMVSGLINRAKSAVQSAINGAKSALGIASPSKVWAKLGVQSVQGYEVGFGDQSAKMAKQISSAIKLPVDSFNRGPSNSAYNTPSVTATTGAQTFLVQISDDQLRPAMVRTLHEAPQDVALASETGSSQLARRR
jgi:phage-related protein